MGVFLQKPQTVTEGTKKKKEKGVRGHNQIISIHVI